MKLKRLLPISILVVASPFVTLVTSCSHGIDIDLEHAIPGYLEPDNPINLKKKQLYELSVDLEDVPAEHREGITQIDSWSIFVSENGETPIPTPKQFKITYIKVWLNDRRQKKDDWFKIDGSQIKSMKPITPGWGDIWDTEIEVDIKISENIDASNFVFQYTG